LFGLEVEGERRHAACGVREEAEMGREGATEGRRDEETKGEEAEGKKC